MRSATGSRGVGFVIASRIRLALLLVSVMTDRERLYRTEGIVLRRSDFGEADRLLVLFTPDYGKLRVLAKGVRKVPSRKAGHVEPFMRSQFLLARGRDLDIVTQVETLDTYQGVRGELERTTFAYYLVELVDAFGEEGGENQALYHLLAESLGRLAAGDDPAMLARFFELRLLTYVGYRPELQSCVGCGAKHEPATVFFCPADGGVRCFRCGQGVPGALPLSLAAFKVLRFLQSQEYAAAAALRLRPDTAREVEATMRSYLSFVLERNLKSVDFLSMVRGHTVQKLDAGRQSE